jgi:hypothetical protein
MRFLPILSVRNDTVDGGEEIIGLVLWPIIIERDYVYGRIVVVPAGNMLCKGNHRGLPLQKCDMT